jgi:hypothetical protein
MGKNVFQNCQNLEQISFAAIDEQLIIDSGCFSECFALQTIIFNNTLDTWKNISFKYPQYLLTNIKYFIYTAENDNTVCITLENNNRPLADEYTSVLKLTKWEYVPPAAFMGAKFFNTVEDTEGTIQQLSEYSFYNCENLDNINNCSSLTRVEAHALDNCKMQSAFDTNLVIVDDWICGVKNRDTTEVQIPKCTENGQPFKFVANAFIDCPALQTVYFDGTIEDWLNLTFTNQWSNPLYNKNNREIALYLKSNNDWVAWDKAVTINLNSAVIHPYVFSGATIDTLTLVDNNTNTALFNSNAFFEAKIAAIRLDCSLLKNKIFSYCSGIRELHITNTSKSNTKLPDNAFKNLEALRVIYFNGKYTEFGNNAFAGCSKLHTIYFNNSFANTAQSWCKIKFNNEFSNPCSQPSFKYLYCLNGLNSYYAVNESTSLYLEAEETLNAFVFLNFKALTSIYLDARKISSLEPTAFYGCLNLRKIADTSNTANTKYLFKSSNVGSYIIEVLSPSAWKIIYGTSGIINILDPESRVTLSLDKAAFSYSKVQELIICNSITRIDSGVLAGQLSLKKLSIPFIGPDSNPNQITTNYHFKYLFGGNYAASSVALPPNLQLTITGNDIKIVKDTFLGCYFAKLQISGNLTYLAENGLDRDNAGQPCFNVNTVSQFGNFYGIGSKDKLAVITNFISDKTIVNTYYIDAPYIYKNAFRNKPTLERYKFICKESVLGIHANAFSNSKLNYLFLPSSLKYLHQSAFSNTSCDTLHIHSSLRPISNNFSGLYSINNIKTIIMPMNFYNLVKGTFVERLVINKIDATGIIPDSAFQNWTKLITVSFKAERNLSDNSKDADPIIHKIGYAAFKNCSQLYNFPWEQLNSTCYRIESEAFRGCKALVSIKLPSALNPIYNTNKQELPDYYKPNLGSYYFKPLESGTYSFISDDFVALYKVRGTSKPYQIFTNVYLTKGVVVEIQIRALTGFDKVQPKFYFFGNTARRIGLSDSESNALKGKVKYYWKISTKDQLIPSQNLLTINKNFTSLDITSADLDTKNEILYTFYKLAKSNSNFGIGSKAFEGCINLKQIIDYAGFSLQKNSTTFGYVAKNATTIINKRA